MRFNAASNQNRFRYYKSSSYTAQKAIALYKHETGTVCTHEGANIVAKPATCTEQATVTINCAECGQEITHITGEALGHSMDEGVVTKEPTCTATGVMTYTCTLCEETQKDEISATGHTYVDGACKDCGEVEPAVETYVKTDLAGIAPQQKVIITVTKEDGNVYALYSGNGTGSAPTAVEVTVIGESIETEKESIYWNISNDNGTLTIYPHGTTDNWLYCTEANNGVRVGTNTNKAFIIDETGYLKHTFTNRYLGVYNDQDWRCYTSHTTANIANQTLAFYVLECDHANTEEVAEKDATCTEVGYTAGVRCKDCGAIVSGCEEIAAKDHSYNAVVTAPTCTEGGYTTHTCSVCQDSYKDSQTEAAGHKDGDSNNICDVCETELENTQPSEPAETVTALSYMFSDYTAGTQYAQGEEHTLDEVVTLTINGAHLNTQIRLYAGSNAVFTSTKVIDSIVVKAGYKVGTLKVYASTNGANWELVSEQATTTAYTDYTFDMPADCKYVKLESVGAQIRVSEMTINVVESGTTEPETPGTTECAHANTTTTSTATCTEAGVETVVCDDCGATVSTTNIEAKGHTDANSDNVCDTCGTAMGSQPSEPVEKTETMNIFGSTGTLASGNSSISWTSDDITFTNEKGSTAIRTTDTDHYRVYANSKVTISSAAGNIKTIVITCTSNAYAGVMETSLKSAGYDVTVNGQVVTVDLSNKSVKEITFNPSAQTRLSEIEVTYFEA